MISYALLWKIDCSNLNPKSGRIKGGPVINLGNLQSMLNVDFDDVVYATERCSRDVDNLTWNVGHVLKLLMSLVDSDYRNSMWCVGRGRTFPCDAYEIRYDGLAGKRNSKAAPYYVKFSISPNGALTIVMMSCHLSR